jgi:hypothetical protein
MTLVPPLIDAPGLKCQVALFVGALTALHLGVVRPVDGLGDRPQPALPTYFFLLRAWERALAAMLFVAGEVRPSCRALDALLATFGLVTLRLLDLLTV